MQHSINKNEIKWRTTSIYVDVETGEKITKEEAIKNYTITKKTKKSHVYKATGTTTYTNECRRTKQIRINFGETTL